MAVTLALTGSLFPEVGDVNFAAIGLVVAAIIALVDLIKCFPTLHPILTSVILLISLLSISILWTDPPSEYGVEKVTNLVTITLLSSLIALIVRDNEELIRLAVVWPIAMLPVAVVSLIGFDGGRAEGFDSNPIWLARSLAVGLLFVVWRVWFAPRTVRLFWTSFIIVLLASAILVTGSRGPILGLIVGILVLVLGKHSGRSFRLLILFFASSVGVLIVFQADYFSSSRIVESILSGDILYSSGRDTLLSDAFAVIREHPEGVGIGNIEHYWKSDHQYPHNLFVEVGAEHGLIVGVIFAFATFATLIRLFWHARQNEYILLMAALLSAGVVNVSVSGDLNARTFFFVLFLSLWVLFWKKRDRVQEDQDQKLHPRKRHRVLELTGGSHNRGGLLSRLRG